jgi:putative methanogenesis marker protein 6
MDTINKMIIVKSSKLLPSDIAMKLYESKPDIFVKETCYGVLVTGEREVVESLILDIRKLDPYGIFIKERGFSPGEPFRCRSYRHGGSKPGFHNLQNDDAMLTYIASGLRALDKGEIPVEIHRKKKLDIDKFMEIIKGSEVSK